MEKFRLFLLGFLLTGMACVIGLIAYFAPRGYQSYQRIKALPYYDSRTHVDGAAADLPDGRVLIVGSSSGDGAKNAEIYTPPSPYDPFSNRFEACAQMPSHRKSGALALTLLDGRVVVLGGSTNSGEPVLPIECYEAQRNHWATIGSLPTGCRVSDASRLPDGNLLISTDSGGSTGLILFSPESGTLKAVGHPWMDVNGTPRITILLSGDALVTHLKYGEGEGTANAFLYLSKEHRTIPLPAMAVNRSQHQATLLQDGRVLITGAGNGRNSAELFDPVSRGFSPAGPMVAPRALHMAVLLSDGRVLIAGGVAQSPNPLSEMDPNTLAHLSEMELKKLIPRDEPLKSEIEVFDPSSNRFSPIPDPPSPLKDSPCSLRERLPDGEILFMSFNGPIIFNPAKNLWHFPTRPAHS